VSWLEPIGDEVKRELRRFPPVAGMAAVVAAWPEVAGEAIARNAWPSRLTRDGTLHVATSSSAWAFELTQLQGEMLPRLHAAVPEAPIAGLRFTPGPIPEAPVDDAPEASRARVEVDTTAAAEGERLAAAVGDEKLRKLVARAAAASLARARSDRPV
jgi:hypothetical protein